MRLVRQAAIGAVLATLSLTVAGGTAAAHAELVSVNPADGEVLDVAPTEVVLTFSEPVSLTGGSVRVLNDDAEDVSTGTSLQNETVTATLADGLADGTYTVVFEIISVDSHASVARRFSTSARRRPRDSLATPSISGATTRAGACAPAPQC